MATRSNVAPTIWLRENFIKCRTNILQIIYVICFSGKFLRILVNKGQSSQIGVKVKANKIVYLVVAAALAVTTARAQETTVVSNILGPEGPLYVDGNLYYVGWISNTLSKWDGRKTTVLNNAPGCGHNGLTLTKQKTFLLACTDEKGSILELDMNGKQLRRWDADNKGNKFVGGINDVVVNADGGAYATVFGPYKELPTTVAGKILYLAPGGRNWTQVADDLNYANGIAVSHETLYVSETVGNCILKFAINRDGSLSNRSNFALLNVLVKNKVDSWWIGPDSMKIDSRGNIYVAQWSGGKILKIAPDGKLLHVFEIAAGDGTTNVAFGPFEKDLYVTVVKDANDPQAKGSIVKIPNVE